MKKILKTLPVILIALLPTFVMASGIQEGLSSISGLFPHSGLAGSTSLTGNNGVIYNVIRILLTLTGLIAVLFVIIGGFWYVTSAGNEEQAEKGRKTLVNAIIGVVVVILSYVIINVISNLVGGGVIF